MSYETRSMSRHGILAWLGLAQNANHGFHESLDMTPKRTWVWVRNTIFTASWCKKVLLDYYGLSVITFEPSIFKTSFQRSAPHAPRPQYGFSSFTILWSENGPFSLKTKH